ncbi:MAG: hypothetical protein U7123_11160 [Potamolinea sp.]
MSVMQMRLIGALVLAATSSLFASTATAQSIPTGFEPIRVETLPDAIERAFYTDSGDLYRNRSIPRQIQYMFGPGLPGRATFPDLEIERDALRLNRIYRDALQQQVSSDSILRTPDLPNPFSSTLRQQSDFRRFGTRVEGSEFILETPPLR